MAPVDESGSILCIRQYRRYTSLGSRGQIKGTLEWSVNFLTERESLVLISLSVFRGGLQTLIARYSRIFQQEPRLRFFISLQTALWCVPR